jgi:CRP-like cAMP-binding protein
VAQPMRLSTADLDSFMLRHTDANIFRESDVAGAIYQVESGCVRLVKYCACGRRCVVAFAMPGDLFGLGSQGPEEIDAEAACDTRISKLNPTGLKTLMDSEPTRALTIIDAAHGGQDHHNEHFLVVSQGHADEKVAWFLHRMTAHFSAQAKSNDHPVTFDLPMPRNDIAEHLGMKFETVSREISRLKELGIIETIGLRKIKVLKPRDLAGRASLDAHENRQKAERGPVCEWMPEALS